MLETYVGAFGVGDAGWAFDDVGPACRVGDLLAFSLRWWFLAAGHGVLLYLEGFFFNGLENWLVLALCRNGVDALRI